jgi:predicted membrane chloride channel (bestrophin family)
MLVAALPLIQLSLLPSAPSHMLHAPRGPLTVPRRGGAAIRMAEGGDKPGNVVHQPSVDQLNPPVDDPWYMSSGSAYAENSRQYRRTVYMHDEWVKHRSSERFIKNLRTIGDSGVAQGLGKELTGATSVALFCVLANMGLAGYQDFDGVFHPSALQDIALFRNLKQLALPTMPFTIAMPALSLLLVFRTNTAYFRWNEARTLWGGVVNSCRNVVRQANTFFPENSDQEELKDVLAQNTAAFAKALRNFLRGPTDDATFRSELMTIVTKGHMTKSQVDACMAAKNRPMFMLNAMSAAVRKANIDPISRSRIDASISTLVDLTGACERVFKSPVPLVYTRHTSRFLAMFLLFLPFGIWPAMGDSWNHWATVPATTMIAFFLLGIEEIGIQIEEPFSILPLEALCNGAIAATIDELVSAKRDPTAYNFPLKAQPDQLQLPAGPPSQAQDMSGVVVATSREQQDKPSGLISRLRGN